LSAGWLEGLADWQRGRSGGALALLVTAPGAGAAAIEAQLAQIGARTYLFEVGRPLALLNPPKPRPVQRVSPLGRVVKT
ncbi:MAG: hypothetical protein DIU80_010460, partial [Chloroflexota bacterium]